MTEPRSTLPLASEEAARLRWFEAFMRGRVKLEQRTIAGLQALLEGVPPLPERKLLWHCALQELLDGTREELHARIEELEILNGQIRAVRASIAKAEMCIHNLSIEFEKLESTESVDSAQAATATSHKRWLDIQSVDVSVRKSRSNMFSSGRAQKEKLEYEISTLSSDAFTIYYEQDLKYRRTVHRQRKGQEQFLNSLSDRIKEHGTKYCVAVRNVGTMMESFSNYIRNISSTCSSSGSTIWASAKNIKPLVDANCHTEAIEFACQQSPMRFSPIYYRNPGSKSRPPSGQTILFGCPLELCTVGKLKRIPPVLEYLLDSFHAQPAPSPSTYALQERWALVNEIEQAWTGVEESDRAIISQLVQGNQGFLIQGYLRDLPEPILTFEDITVAEKGLDKPPILTWNTWNKDPIKKAVIAAIISRLAHAQPVDSDILGALAQKAQELVPSSVERLLNFLSTRPGVLRAPASSIRKGNQ